MMVAKKINNKIAPLSVRRLRRQKQYYQALISRAEKRIKDFKIKLIEIDNSIIDEFKKYRTR